MQICANPWLGSTIHTYMSLSIYSHMTCSCVFTSDKTAASCNASEKDCSNPGFEDLYSEGL